MINTFLIPVSYAQNYAGIIGTSLAGTADREKFNKKLFLYGEVKI